LIEKRVAEEIVSLCGFRLLANRFDHLLHRQIQFLLTRVNARVGAMTIERVALLDFYRLLDGFVFAAADDGGGDDVKIDERESRVNVIRIELYRPQPFGLRFADLRHPSENAGFLRLTTVRHPEVVM